jgi:transcriptional regulator with XRE-family HTH domain
MKKHMKLDYPTTAEDAIRAICYLRAWDQKELADRMGLKSSAYICKILKGQEKGTDKFRDRVLEHMPEKLKRKV